MEEKVRTTDNMKLNLTVMDIVRIIQFLEYLEYLTVETSNAPALDENNKDDIRVLIEKLRSISL